MRHILPTNRPSVFGPSTELDAFFDNFFATPTSTALAAMKPKCDIEETPEAFLLSLDLPGIKEEDIHVELDDGYLTISGERTKDYKSTENGVSRSEKYYGKFERSFRLPDGVTEKDIEAHYESGVLELMVPKVKEEPKEAKKIEVKSGNGGSFFSKWLGSNSEN